MSAPAPRALAVAVLVLSDRAARGERDDASGPALRDELRARGARVVRVAVLPDDEAPIADTLRRWCDAGDLDVVLTCGGTGLSPRDVTPEATAQVLERELPGFAEAMRAASRAVTPHALLSRARAGTRGRTLVLNLPGSPRAARENLAAVWDAVPHAVAKLQGDPADCARPDA